MGSMAKGKKRNPGAGRPSVNDPRLPVTSFRGRQEFIDWFNKLAQKVRLPKAIILEHAIIEYAKANGFDEPPPER